MLLDYILLCGINVTDHIRLYNIAMWCIYVANATSLDNVFMWCINVANATRLYNTVMWCGIVYSVDMLGSSTLVLGGGLYGYTQHLTYHNATSHRHDTALDATLDLQQKLLKLLVTITVN